MATGAKRGWIGVDVGSGAIKVAQLARNGARFELIDAAAVRRTAPWLRAISEGPSVESSADEIRGALSIAQRMRGSAAAAVVSMSVCQYHSQHAAADSSFDPELLRSELSRNGATVEAPQMVGAWATATDAPSPAGLRHAPNLGAVSLAQQISDELDLDLTRARLDCRQIDALPTALARATRLMVPNRKVPLAVMDWGYAGTTFCSVREVVPAYVRRFKQCEFRETIEEIAQKLGCSQNQALRLLAGQGVRSNAEPPASAGEAPLTRLLRPHLERLLTELRRTMQFLQTRRRELLPAALLLTGAGAALPGLAGWLHERLQFPVHTWRPDPNLVELPDELSFPVVLLAPAMAASALAWE